MSEDSPCTSLILFYILPGFCCSRNEYDQSFGCLVYTIYLVYTLSGHEYTCPPEVELVMINVVFLVIFSFFLILYVQVLGLQYICHRNILPS